MKHSTLKIKLSKSEIYFIASFFGFIVGLLIFIFFAPNYFKGPSVVKIEIPQGSTLNIVIDSLYQRGIIHNKTFMHMAAFITGAEKKIKAGKYKIRNGMSYITIIDLLVKGGISQQKLLTIPEGIWQFNIAALIKRELSLDSAKFMELSNDRVFINNLGIEAASLEGYMLPESYFFDEDVNEMDFISRLKSEMDKIFSIDSVSIQIQKLNMTKHQILTLASIIEGESNIISEFKTISGVYHNRLKKGMPLQADPTIQYLKRHRSGKNRVLYKDLEINSPYNTYKFSGLPPGPINNPGRDAILAAVFPVENDYYYFVADGTGAHKFAKSLSEHLRNVEDYRRWRRSQK